MNNIRYYILGLKCMLLGMLVVCVGCVDEYLNTSGIVVPSTSYHYLKPSTTSIDFDSKASTKYLQVTSENAKWAIQNNASWLTISPKSGNTTENVKISAAQHLSGDTSRITIMNLVSTLNDWEYSRSLKVSQSSATPYLVPSVTEVTLSGASCSTNVKISSNSAWTASSDNSWLKPTKLSEDELQISVDENQTNDSRSGYIILRYRGNIQYITVIQTVSELTVSQLSIESPKEAARFELTIESEAAWKISTSGYWIQVTPDRGEAGASVVEISTTENNSIYPRTGYVYVYIGAHQKAQIEIEQRGVYLESTDELILPSKAKTTQLRVESNTSWVVRESPDWLSFSSYRGEGTQTLALTPTENNATMARHGVVVIAHDYLDLYNEILVTQEGKTFDVDVTTLEFGVMASAQTLNITSELPWQSRISDSWISTNISRGNGNAEVSVSVTETQSYEERYGTIDYSVVDKNVLVNVHQLAKYFVIADQSFNFSPKGGVSKLSFYTNEPWRIELGDDANWFTLSETEGMGDGDIVVSVSENLTLSSRQSAFTLHKSGQSIEFVVRQNAQYLYTDVLEFQWFAKGGEKIFAIRAASDYKVESSCDWIVVQRVDGDIWCVNVSENTEPVVREGVICVELTSLSEGEKVITIPVTQTYKGGIYIDRAFETEVNWDVTSTEGLSISIHSYSADDCWDATDGEGMNDNGININKSEYADEVEW